MFKKQNDNPSSSPMPENRPRGSAVPSIIGSDVRIVGNVSTPGEVQLDGIVEGDLVCGSLTVGEHGIVTGTVKADTLNLRGRIEGKLKVKTVHLQKTAQVLGDIAYETMTMEAGVQVQGKLLPARRNAPKAEPAPARRSAAAAKTADKKAGNGQQGDKLPL